MKKSVIILSLFSAVTALILLQQCKTAKQVYDYKAAVDGNIRGYVYAEVRDDNKDTLQVYLPGVSVTVKDMDGKILDEVQTGFDGSYSTKTIKKGNAQICLNKNGFKLSCYTVEIAQVTNHQGPLKINFNDENYIWGTAKLKDGKIGFYHQSFFGMDINTEVGVETKVATVTTTCNQQGLYLLTGIAPGDKGVITASCQKAKAVSELNGKRRIDLTFMNTSPLVQYIMVINKDDKAVLRAKTGERLVLKANAIDSEKNTIHYKWIPFLNVPAFEPKDAPEISWQLPDMPGRYEIGLVVYDNFGGISYKNFTINAGQDSLNFAGTISDAFGNERIANAKVTVNSIYSITADNRGYYRFKVPVNDSDRYVLTINKPGYALYSKVYSMDAIQKNYSLVKATVQTFDPGKDISLSEAEDAYTHFSIKETNTQRSAAKIFIPANSIVDAKGNKVTASVSVSLRMIDPADNNGLLPGNNEGIYEGKTVRLQSLGVADIKVWDKQRPDIKYELKNGANAFLTMPVFSQLGGILPQNIINWCFNLQDGSYFPCGILTGEGQIQLSTINNDINLAAPATHASTTDIVLMDRNGGNSVFSAPGTIKIKLFIPLPNGGTDRGTVVATLNSPLDLLLSNLLPVEHLDENTVYTIQIIRNAEVINTLNVRTGQNTGPTSGNPFGGIGLGNFFIPDGSVYVNMLPDKDNEIINSSSFLNCFSNTGDEAEKYYEAIFAIGYNNTNNIHRVTFSEWKLRNGFTNIPGIPDHTIARAVYKNAGDLGIWRRMQASYFNSASFTSDYTYSFYVSNFSNDIDAINNQNVIATVCMEYSRNYRSTNIYGAPNQPFTKFFVFNGLGELIDSVDLDGNGKKAVPGLCLNCHGGTALDFTDPHGPYKDGSHLQEFFTTSSNRAAMPNFLPFDLKSFIYSDATGYSRNDQEEAFRKLNLTIMYNKTTQAINDFVNASYHGNPAQAGQLFDDNAIVDKGGPGNSWNDYNPDPARSNIVPAQFYTDIIGTSCRTCHIASADRNLWFDNKLNFDTIGTQHSIAARFACAKNGYMPNSQVTFNSFWNSEAPYRPEEIRKFFNYIGYCYYP